MNESLRKRTANFTATETDLLISLVKKYKTIVECLKTDTVSVKMKKDAWLKIESEFNRQSVETHRTEIVLKNKYENIKRNAKKQYTDKNMSNQSTSAIAVRGTEKESVQQSPIIDKHKLKMHLMQEKHKKELSMMAEKHALEMKNLLLQNEILKIQKDKVINGS